MKLTKLITDLAYKYGVHDIFSDFVEMAAIAISNSVDKPQFDVREERYMRIVKRYTKDEVRQFSVMLGALVDEMENTGGDVLGRAFGELEVHNKHRGQFFTPYELCCLMAAITAGRAELQDAIDRQGHVTVNEPTSGAGAMIIAFADTMRERGFNPQTQLHVTAQDVDPRAVHMTYLQLSLMHIPAVVILGNTLALEQREVWYTPAHIMGGWWRKLKQRYRHNWLIEQAVKLEAAPVAMPEPDAVTAPETAPAPIVLPSAKFMPEQLGLF